jgi:anion-transporting  ArsA/GET3 family ATPase
MRIEIGRFCVSGHCSLAGHRRIIEPTRDAARKPLSNSAEYLFPGMSQLFDHRLLLLAGKGGVGRTTVAAALARAAIRKGKRVLIAQTNAPERLGRLLGLGHPIGAEVEPVDDGLWAVNMRPKEALHQYGVMLLRFEPLYRAFFENKPMRSFLGAFPGLDYWTMLGKAWWHTTEMQDGRPKYDLVILDGPASGHAAAMLRIPDAVRSAMPRGPLARDAEQARTTLSDPGLTSVVLVTLPEELPARETLVLVRDLKELRIPMGPLVVNGMPPAEAADPIVERIVAADTNAAASPALTNVVAGISVLGARRRDAERTVASLALDPGLPMLQLPRLPSNGLGPAEITQLADILAAAT